MRKQKGATMRVSARPVLARLLAIDSAVRRHEWPNAPALARQLEVAPRTIQRDIAFMRDQLRAPIEFDTDKNGFYYAEASYQLPYFQLTEGELVALLVASQVMKHYRGTPFERDIRQALAKISELLPDQVELSLEDLSYSLSVLPRVQTAYDPQIFRGLLSAIRRSRQVRMNYWSASRDETRDRLVDPYDMVLAPDDDWCLFGHCHLRNTIRMFKIQRVRSVEETGESFSRPDGFRARDYMADSFGTIRGDGEYHVVLRFTRAYAGLIAEKQWHPSQVVEPQPDGSLILRLHVNDLRFLKRWVMFWGAECEVIEPIELSEVIASELSSMLATYGESTDKGSLLYPHCPLDKST
jgi:proteasome accessory factor B